MQGVSGEAGTRRAMALVEYVTICKAPLPAIDSSCDCQDEHEQGRKARCRPNEQPVDLFVRDASHAIPNHLCFVVAGTVAVLHRSKHAPVSSVIRGCTMNLREATRQRADEQCLFHRNRCFAYYTAQLAVRTS